MHRVWLAIAICMLAVCRATAADRPPSVLLILTDDQGWTGTSVQMDPDIEASRSDFYRTPALEKLAARGMRFSNAYAPHPNCSPTRYAILTGKSPSQLHMTDIIGRRSGDEYEGNPLNPPLSVNDIAESEITIAELLKQIDPRYKTAHFGKWHLGGGGPGKHGFDEHDGATDNGQGKREGEDPKRTREISASALAFLEKRAKDGAPFFLQVSYYAVHKPVMAEAETVLEMQRRLPGKLHGDIRYAAMTEELDRGMGTLLDRFHALGLDKHTLLIFTSDNGPVVYDAGGPTNVTSNKPLNRGKASVYEGGIRVPLIVAGAGIEPGTHSDVVVSGLDFLPTIAAWAGFKGKPTAGVEGGDLLPLLTAKAKAVTRPREELVHHFPHYQRDYGTTPQSSLRLGNYKLIRFWEDGTHRLFDLDQDIGETQDLAPSMPERAAELEARLMRYLDEIDAQLPTVNPDRASR